MQEGSMVYDYNKIVKEIENGLISQIIEIAKRPKYRWKYGSSGFEG